MPKQTPYPSGPIAVEDARLKDISVGMDWNMQDASDVRFLAVSGTLWVGACRTTYDFTLVEEYHLHIDEVSWTIFSTLNNALEQEFAPEFWEMVNPSRKERWGFLEIPWDGKAYEVAAPYTQIRLSIFNDFAHTMRVVRPFVWNDTYLKVHPNGAAVFTDQKKLAFLLPLIIEAHALLPPTPLFWVNDDQTIPLRRTTLWLHEHTIQWLSETGEAYPPELRNEIQPRLDKLKPSQPAKKLQPPPPKPSRWQERPKEKQIMQAPQEPAQQDPKGAQTSPQQVADHERQYMELQATFARMSQRTIAESRPTNSTQSPASASLSASSPPTTEETNTTSPPKISTNAVAEAPDQQGSHRPPKVSAQSLADQRPAPPSPPATHEPKTDTPGTGELSTHSPSSSEQIGAKQQPPPKHEQPTAKQKGPTERPTPVDSPTESSDTLATDTVFVSSPEPACEPVREDDLFAADIPTLQNWQRVDGENVEVLTTRLARARDNLSRITKRLKTMQDSQETGTPPASPIIDVEMELMD